MVGSGKLRTIVRKALEQMTALGITGDSGEVRDFVLSYGGQELRDVLDTGQTELLDRVIAEERQGNPGQLPLMIFIRSKGASTYTPYTMATTTQKNGYLRRKNLNLVRLREKAKSVRDDIEAAGDRAAELFVVGRAIDAEEGDVIRIEPMTTARIQMMFPEWFLEEQFGIQDADDEWHEDQDPE